MNWYKRHIGDYTRDTAHLSLLEHGIYNRLLDVYYARESGIPDDQAERLICARSQSEISATRQILKEFFVLQDGAWTSKRCDDELCKYRKNREIAEENGRLGGRKKTKIEPKQKPDGLNSETKLVSKSEPDGFISETNSKANQEPETKNQEPEGERARTQPHQPRFSEDQVQGIYAAYPRKVAKGAAINAIRRALVNIARREKTPEDPVGWLLDRVLAYAESPAGNAGRFTPHPATWFNQARYDDDPAVWQQRDGPKDQTDKPAWKNPFEELLETPQ